jgi:hypothetical protein
VHVQRFRKLVMQVLRFLLSFQEFLLKHENLALKVWNTLSLHFGVVELSLCSPNQVYEPNDIINLLLVVVFTLGQRRLLNLDLLVEET